MKTKEELKAEQRKLIDSVKFRNEEYKLIKPRLNEIEKEINDININELVNNINAKQARIRALAKQVWDCETPKEDVTTIDGSFHKTKVKKYPVLNQLNSSGYIIGKFHDGLLLEINNQGHVFRMYVVEFKGYNEPNEYIRPATFEDFLKLNNVMVQDITVEEYKAFAGKLQELNTKLDHAIEAYEHGRKELNVSLLSYFGMVDQRNLHVYKYEPKY